MKKLHYRQASMKYIPPTQKKKKEKRKKETSTQNAVAFYFQNNTLPILIQNFPSTGFF